MHATCFLPWVAGSRRHVFDAGEQKPFGPQGGLHLRKHGERVSVTRTPFTTLKNDQNTLKYTWRQMRSQNLTAKTLTTKMIDKFSAPPNWKCNCKRQRSPRPSRVTGHWRSHPAPWSEKSPSLRECRGVPREWVSQLNNLEQHGERVENAT